MEASQSERAQAFRALHARPGAFVIPNPWDIGTARILAGLGFEALATTSAGMAFALGRRDGAVSRDEALAHARAIVGATPLPVSADLENGFGDAPEVVAETIRLAANTGLAGASIEDASGDPDRPIYDASLALERVAAAIEAARALPFPFTLTARAENFLHGRPDLDDTIRRLQAFERAGADVLYAPGLRDLATMRTVISEISRPLNVVMSAGDPGLTAEQLASVGVKRVSVGGALSRLALAAFMKGARDMREGSFAWMRETMPSGELKKVFRSLSSRAG
jgi:2-methylisocitrate lyase-like PEP mutase family enzyme